MVTTQRWTLSLLRMLAPVVRAVEAEGVDDIKTKVEFKNFPPSIDRSIGSPLRISTGELAFLPVDDMPELPLKMDEGGASMHEAGRPDCGAGGQRRYAIRGVRT